MAESKLQTFEQSVKVQISGYPVENFPFKLFGSSKNEWKIIFRFALLRMLPALSGLGVHYSKLSSRKLCAVWVEIEIERYGNRLHFAIRQWSSLWFFSVFMSVPTWYKVLAERTCWVLASERFLSWRGSNRNSLTNWNRFYKLSWKLVVRRPSRAPTTKTFSWNFQLGSLQAKQNVSETH